LHEGADGHLFIAIDDALTGYDVTDEAEPAGVYADPGAHNGC